MINGINGVDNNDLVDIQSYLEKKKKKKSYLVLVSFVDASTLL